ncbi:MAG: hypothetical protein AUJ85_01890 [Elusimicrobia bacterium CG1_02_37_114]|nr:MAG: hypothetical protein AUJ85_01890 [Elusimicrobia bacterium CG1_02_37_114]PIV53869.1 MAG: DUF2321 domain-containing protein [Elusimicrobia bacterium CG02_land_8_20_14_3_00_37_13]PIZ14220.1 MAG: DUF2321 domain-containing protein [Elusimicrobia bacterium CG_4_10_14_0_8_um_filter_37_32]
MSDFDTAQICLNGHIICSGIKVHPEKKQKYCQLCGSETITKCNHCSTDIRGNYTPGQYNPTPMDKIPPPYCYSCGKPFPWTESKINSIKELTDEIESLTNEDKESLKNSIADIISNTPRTELGANRIKKYLSKAGKEVSQGFRDILVDIASETAKKILFPTQ